MVYQLSKPYNFSELRPNETGAERCQERRRFKYDTVTPAKNAFNHYARIYISSHNQCHKS